MGLGNFFKKKKKGVDRLPTTSFESVVLDNFEKGVPFRVTLPINVTVQTSGSSLVYLRVGMFGKGFYSPPEYETTFQKIYTHVKCDSEKVIIKHALNNGQHIFVYLDDIAGAKMYKDGVAIELINGTQYIFALDDYIINLWASSGFSTDYLRVFYKILTRRTQIGISQNIQYAPPPKLSPYGEMLKNKEKNAKKRQEEFNNALLEKQKKRREKRLEERRLEEEKERKAKFEQKTKEREQIKEERILKQGLKTCPNCGENIPSNAVRCKYCKTMLKEYENNPEYRKKQQELLKNPKVDVTEIKETPSKNIEETIEVNEDSVEKIEEVVEVNEDSVEKIEEVVEVNEDSVEKIEEVVEVNEDPFEKIKKAKELLDMGAITPEEFDKIKSKYFKQITESDNGNDESDNGNEESGNGNDGSNKENEESDNGEPLCMPGSDYDWFEKAFYKSIFGEDDD